MTDLSSLIADQWVEHDGNGMPVGGSVMVTVKHADGALSGPLRADFWLGGLEPWEGRCISECLRIVAYLPLPPRALQQKGSSHE